MPKEYSMVILARNVNYLNLVLSYNIYVLGSQWMYQLNCVELE